MRIWERKVEGGRRSIEEIEALERSTSLSPTDIMLIQYSAGLYCLRLPDHENNSETNLSTTFSAICVAISPDGVAGSLFRL